MTDQTTSSGTLCTSGVVGVYWMISRTSLRNTTCPGVAPTFSPTVNGLESTCRGMPRLCLRSETRLRAPRTRLMPPVSKACLRAVGLPASVFVGARALARMPAAKRARSRVCQSTSALSTASLIARSTTR